MNINQSLSLSLSESSSLLSLLLLLLWFKNNHCSPLCIGTTSRRVMLIKKAVTNS